MDDKQLLENLVSGGFLTKEAADKVLKDASVVGKTAEDLINERNLVPDIEVANIKSKLLKIPYKKVNVEELTKELLLNIPEEVARNYKVIPLGKSKDLLVVGMVHPSDPQAQQALRFVAKQQKINLGVYLVSTGDFDLAINRYSPYKDVVEEAIRALSIKPGKGAEAAQRLVQLEAGFAVSEEAPIIRLVASTLKEALNRRASDIHIEPQKTETRIRFRIDGELHEVSRMPVELHQPIVSRIKVLSNLKLDETRIPQDGRFRSVIFGRDIDFRVATFPTPAGEKAAIRVLDSSVGLKSLEDLGLRGRSAEFVKEAIEKPFGLILITGPTGSGKSTSLYALLHILSSEDTNVVSLEDPVEYYIEGINQSQVHPEIGYDFASGLRQILRQDPDVIMVGEVRDVETAQLTIHAALTGHIVLSTLHTNNSIGVIPRLIDMKIDSFLLPSSLNLMMAQRLVGKLCQSCKKAEAPAGQVAEIIKKEIEKLPADMREKAKTKYKEIKIYHSPGCKDCHDKGFVGRLAIFEALKMTPELQNIISTGATEARIVEEARRQGMVNLRQDGILKALDGLVSIEEILRETEEL
ncbi:MAG: type II/IV secretion system protein [Candidatus Harrisonbacteria bacterium]|nr:type II/IV secretion system protein [Candidatus Harrisonbacteria bacterium]